MHRQPAPLSLSPCLANAAPRPPPFLRLIIDVGGIFYRHINMPCFGPLLWVGGEKEEEEAEKKRERV